MAPDQHPRTPSYPILPFASNDKSLESELLATNLTNRELTCRRRALEFARVLNRAALTLGYAVPLSGTAVDVAIDALVTGQALTLGDAIRATASRVVLEKLPTAAEGK